jgi:hypothetical protein
MTSKEWENMISRLSSHRKIVALSGIVLIGLGGILFALISIQGSGI